MTKEELEDINRRYANGETLREIANAYGCTYEWIRLNMRTSANASRTIRGVRTVIFPGIRKWMIENCRTKAQLAGMIGSSPENLRNWLAGKNDMPLRVVKKILKATGMTFEEAFVEVDYAD